MNMKKIIGFIAFFVAIGMLIMLITHSRLVGLIIIALLLFLGYHCICSDWRAWRRESDSQKGAGGTCPFFVSSFHSPKRKVQTETCPLFKPGVVEPAVSAIKRALPCRTLSSWYRHAFSWRRRWACILLSWHSLSTLRWSFYSNGLHYDRTERLFHKYHI